MKLMTLIRYVIGISVQSAESINQAIYDLMMIFGNENIRKRLDEAEDEEAILKAINNLHKISGTKPAKRR